MRADSLLMATRRHAVAQNRLPLFPQKRTFRRAENDPLFLLILGWTFLSLAPVTVGLVWVYQLPLVFYSDAVSSVVVGVLFLLYRWQVTSRGASAADVNSAPG